MFNDLWLDFTTKLQHAHKSATIRFNMYCETINEALPLLLPVLIEHMPELQEYMPPSLFTNLMRIVLIANMMYRFKTTQSLADKK